MNNKLFSVTGSKFANLYDYVAEISIAENIYHNTDVNSAPTVYEYVEDKAYAL